MWPLYNIILCYGGGLRSSRKEFVVEIHVERG